MNPEKPAKVVMIERSLNCLACGLVGLIPVLGLPLAIRALQQSWRVKRDGAGMWNPAERYLQSGAMCARIGLGVSLILVGFVAVILAFNFGSR